ncbi:MAG: methyltransferase domain-containing protein [Alcanivorax sp.]|uniref:class I SAM-dependent methyltransferase n=1 Tax=Alloalcanivorax marinus TaxID=1177169 RepID=UPI00195EDCBD|nr:methyltransferase domain-containing protein [Alloalcanivorax marinus]MBM7335331.1 methyltransferase domain-containing protein [Alloalcanivorax marinus]
MQLPPLSRAPFRRQPEDMVRRFDHWLESEAGQAVLAAERAMLADWLPKLVGQRALEISGGRGRDLLAGIRLPWRCSVMPVHCADQPDGDPAGGADSVTGAERPPVRVKACPQALPVAKNSVDVVLLHHGLEFQDNPHRVLREAASCVAPGGTIAVVGFHPLSVMGLARWLRGGASRPGWSGRYFRPYRVSDWLHVLGFEVEGLAGGFYNLPLADRGRARLRWLEWLGGKLWWRFGGVYLLVARKRAAMMRPLAPQRAFSRQRPTVVSVPVARWRQERNTE